MTQKLLQGVAKERLLHKLLPVFRLFQTEQFTADIITQSNIKVTTQSRHADINLI